MRPLGNPNWQTHRESRPDSVEIFRENFTMMQTYDHGHQMQADPGARDTDNNGES